MNTDLRKKAKNDFGKDFFKWMNNAVFRKTIENVREHRDFRFLTTEKRKKSIWSRNKIIILSTTNYQVFHRTSISNRNEKIEDTYE